MTHRQLFVQAIFWVALLLALLEKSLCGCLCIALLATVHVFMSVLKTSQDMPTDEEFDQEMHCTHAFHMSALPTQIAD